MTDTSPHQQRKPTTQLGPFAALLFDMDGTLLNSTAVSERMWRAWCDRHQLEFHAVMQAAQGRRTLDTVRRFCPPDINADTEAQRLIAQEEADMHGIVAVAGARTLLNKLPGLRWAVVTSANLALARARLSAASLPEPPVLVTAEDVIHGKPAPEGYELAARRLGVSPTQCLVLEDAPAGVQAALAAKATVRVIRAVHSHADLQDFPYLTDFEGLDPVLDDRGVWITGIWP